MSQTRSKPLEDDHYDSIHPFEIEALAQLEIIRARRQEGTIGFDRDMANATAALLRAVTAAQGERRQLLKARARELADIPMDEVITYLRSLPDRDRQDIADQIRGANDLEPLL